MGDLSPLGGALVVAAFASAAVGLVLAVVAWRRRDTRGARPFVWFVLAQSGWAAAAGAVWISPTFRVALAFKAVSHVLAVGSLVTWVAFVVAYTRRREDFRGWPRRLFFGCAAAFLLLRAANPATELLFTDVQPASFQGLTLVQWTATDLFIGYLVVIYGVTFWTYWLLVRFATTAIGGEGRQALTILGADLAFVGINFAYYAGGYSLHPALDPSPILFTVTVVIVAIALFVYDFLDVEPLASNLLVEEMDDPAIVRYDSGRPVALNGPASELVPPEAETLAEACPALAAALDADESTTVLDADGDERVFDLSVSRIRTRDGRSRGDLLVLRDITLRRRRERELERQNERLDRFADVVSHDLRNPLNVASGRLELARTECDSDHLDGAADAVDRMETLVDDLLTLAREGEAVGDVEPVDLTTLADACWSTVATDGAVLQTDPALTVRANPSRLRQVLENLFRNVIEHGGTTVTVGSLPEGRGFYVADDGPGIPEAERDQVFDSGYSTATDGTGFGLAIVAEIVEAHGWAVSVTDGEDGGARFEVVTSD